MSARELGIPHVPVTVEETDLQRGAIKILEIIRPSWSPDKIEFKVKKLLTTLKT